MGRQCRCFRHAGRGVVSIFHHGLTENRYTICSAGGAAGALKMEKRAGKFIFGMGFWAKKNPYLMRIVKQGLLES